MTDSKYQLTLKSLKDDLCPSLSSSQLTLTSCHICACTCSCVHEYMCTCVWKPEVNTEHLPPDSPLALLRQGLSWTWGSPVPSAIPRDGVLTLHAALGLHSCLSLLLAFTWVLGFKVRPSCLRGKHFTDEAFSPPQISNSYIKIASTFILCVCKFALIFNKL